MVKFQLTLGFQKKKQKFAKKANNFSKTFLKFFLPVKLYFILFPLKLTGEFSTVQCMYLIQSLNTDFTHFTLFCSISMG